MEIWRDIINYEGEYQVSNLGNVKSIKFDKHTILKQSKNKGYYHVMLYKNGLSKTYKVHVLVAKMFCPNLDNKPFVNHMNSLKNDNSAENLEWCTSSENILHAYKHGKMKSQKGENNNQSKLTEQDVYKIRFETDGMTYLEISKKFNIHKNYVGLIKNNRRWQHVIKKPSTRS